MGPDDMAKYRLPMLTDLKKNFIHKKKSTFYLLPPCSSEGVFGRVSAFCIHPCGFFLQKANIDETIRGGKFCWALIWATIVVTLSLKSDVENLAPLDRSTVYLATSKSVHDARAAAARGFP